MDREAKNLKHNPDEDSIKMRPLRPSHFNPLALMPCHFIFFSGGLLKLHQIFSPPM